MFVLFCFKIYCKYKSDSCVEYLWSHHWGSDKQTSRKHNKAHSSWDTLYPTRGMQYTSLCQNIRYRYRPWKVLKVVEDQLGLILYWYNRHQPVTQKDQLHLSDTDMVGTRQGHKNINWILSDTDMVGTTNQWHKKINWILSDTDMVGTTNQWHKKINWILSDTDMVGTTNQWHKKINWILSDTDMVGTNQWHKKINWILSDTDMVGTNQWHKISTRFYLILI